MARIVPKSQIEVPKLVVKDVTSSKNEHLVIKANKSDDDVYVKVDDLLQVDKIEPLHNDFVQIDNLKVAKIDYTESQDDVEFEKVKTNCIKIGTDNDYKNLIKYYNNSIQIIGSDDQSNKIVIGYNMMDDPDKYFIGTIALNTKNGNFQCNNIQCNEIQATNLHFHDNLSVLNTITSDHIKDIHNHLNKSYLDTIDQNLSKIDDVEFDRLTITARMYIKNPNDGQLAISLYTHN